MERAESGLHILSGCAFSQPLRLYRRLRLTIMCKKLFGVPPCLLSSTYEITLGHSLSGKRTTSEIVALFSDCKIVHLKMIS